MQNWPDNIREFVCTMPTDRRKQFDGLHTLFRTNRSSVAAILATDSAGSLRARSFLVRAAGYEPSPTPRGGPRFADRRHALNSARKSSIVVLSP